ncbi:TipC family immunity protein [Vagococcus sp. BWB3-3]|uniref:TipC family immunity protein n=1 Tax=Vagococcus allomyrinae TaxID=2794353 RepID=A0A940P5L1_9ENTE|nr:TipC family immunity protein [Vagococcus allomyrinae]MBP1040186.1 TipC family immunity protein [Vagococcus allomyrinae]
MKKPLKKLLILLTSLIGILIVGNSYNRIKIQNIFDEIYYAGAGATNEPFEKPRSVLENIPNIESQVYYLSSISENGEKITKEVYQKSTLPEDMFNLSIKFYSKKKKVNINVSYSITSTVNLSMDNTYSVSKKTLSQTLSFFDTERAGEILVKDKNDVQTYLATYNISEKQLTEWNAQGMNQLFLEDWVSVYPSNYSPENLGNVKIETAW